MVSIDSITFENPKVDARRHWQDIMSEGEVIGAICETSTGIHKALDTRYQVITPEENQDKAENWYISEDKGYIFAYFRTLEGLVDFINETAK